MKMMRHSMASDEWGGAAAEELREAHVTHRGARCYSGSWACSPGSRQQFLADLYQQASGPLKIKKKTKNRRIKKENGYTVLLDVDWILLIEVEFKVPPQILQQSHSWSQLSASCSKPHSPPSWPQHFCMYIRGQRSPCWLPDLFIYFKSKKVYAHFCTCLHLIFTLL